VTPDEYDGDGRVSREVEMEVVTLVAFEVWEGVVVIDVEETLVALFESRVAVGL